MKFRFKSLILLLLFLGLFLIPAKTFAATTIFSDSFGGSSTLLSSHTPNVGTSWSLLVNNGMTISVWNSTPGYVSVTSNASAAGSIYTADATYSTADYEIFADAVFSAGASNYPRSLILRAQDANNMYLLRTTNSTMTIYKRVSGTWTSLGSGSISITDNLVSPYYIATLGFSVTGTTLVGKLNGVTKVTVTDSSISAAGKAGIGLGATAVASDNGGTGVEMDTVLVQTTSVDTTPPTISSVSSTKANGSYKAGDVIDVNVTFSEAVTSTGNVTVTLETGATDRTCTFAVTNSTTGSCNYTVQAGDTSSDLTVNTISGTIADQASNAMSDFSIATNLAANKDLVIDTTAPTISSTAPASSATINSQTVSYTLSETASSASVVFTRTSGTADAGSPHTCTLQGTALASGAHTSLTLATGANACATWSAPLVSGAVYTAVFNASDVAGNSASAVTNTSVTYDTTAPVVTLLSPLDNATGISPTTDLVMTFSKAVTVQTGNITIKKVSDNSTVETIDVTSGLVTGSGTSVITINPSSTLNSTGGYYVIIDSGSFRDSAGNNYAGISLSTDWNFSTTDTVPPVITLLGSVGIALIAPTTYTDAGATASDNIDGDITRNIVTSGSVNPLAPGTYVISYSVSDSSGNVATPVSRTVTVTAQGGIPLQFLQIINDNARKAQEEDKAKQIQEVQIKTDQTTAEIKNTFVGFTKSLKYGLKNEDEVRQLQKFLNANGFLIASKGPGSPGNETDYFGPGTKKAVQKFQMKYFKEILVPSNNTAPTGIVGEYTRKKINEILNGENL